MYFYDVQSLLYGIIKGSVIVPFVFTVYTHASSNVTYTQVDICMEPHNGFKCSSSLDNFKYCVGDNRLWMMTQTILKLNHDKTHLIYLTYLKIPESLSHESSIICKSSAKI